MVGVQYCVEDVVRLLDGDHALVTRSWLDEQTPEQLEGVAHHGLVPVSCCWVYSFARSRLDGAAELTIAVLFHGSLLLGNSRSVELRERSRPSRSDRPLW